MVCGLLLRRLRSLRLVLVMHGLMVDETVTNERVFRNMRRGPSQVTKKTFLVGGGLYDMLT